MRAVWYERFGSAIESLVFGELDKPPVCAGDVLVRLHASGVNPSDVKKRAGAFPDLLKDGRVVPHSDGAGIIEAVGDQVDAERIGQRVWVYQAQYGRRYGTAAEYLAIDTSRAVALPDNISFEIGACLGIPVMTAHRCVFADGSVEGQTLLVTGGAGRVGYYAIQLASQAGARVIATASNDANRAVCLSVGADEVINHREADWGQQVLSVNNNRVDRVIDVEFGANLGEVLHCIKTSGVIAAYASSRVREPQLPFLQMMYMDLTIRMVIVYAMPEPAKQKAITDINRMLANCELRHRVTHVIAFEDMVKAHELIEKGGFGGCVVVQI